MALRPGQADLDKLRLYKATFERSPTLKGAADQLGIHPSSLRKALKRYDEYVKEGFIDDKPLFGGRDTIPENIKLAPPAHGVRRVFLTCAQSCTEVNEAVWATVMQVCDDLDAELYVSTFTYNHNAYGKLAVKKGTQKTQDNLWFDHRVRPYINDDDIELADTLVWLGGENILPTAEKPLTGYETHQGRKSIVIPHVKVAMMPVASGKNDPTKFAYTTGTVTQRNYIQKKAGRKAEHHHSYGGLLVEIDAQGRWLVWQIICDEINGSAYHLDALYTPEGVTRGHRLEAIVWGDIHLHWLSPEMKALCWGLGGILDTLQPRHQIFHDTLDFRSRNHHDAKNPHARFAMWNQGAESVEEEIQDAAAFLLDTSREWCVSHIVDSNHDRALNRWLREADYRQDPVNAIFFLEAQKRYYESIRDNEKDFHLFEWACGLGDRAHFLRQDESLVLGGVEHGMHGDEGPNGTKGTVEGLKRIGRRATIADKHSPGIYEGLYVAGVLGDLDQGYNTGPSSWAHANVFLYPNGKRVMSSIWDNRWCF